LTQQRRKALSPVIAAVILSGVVLAVGGAIWSYSLGAATVTANYYVNQTLDLVNDIVERYDIEHILYNSTSNDLTVWVFNYGEVDITVYTYVHENGTMVGSNLGVNNSGVEIPQGDCSTIVINFSSSPLPSGVEVTVKVHSERDNNAYETYSIQ